MTNTIFSVASELAEQAESVTIRMVKFNNQPFLIVEPVMGESKEGGLCEPFSIQYERGEPEAEIVAVFSEWVATRSEVFDAAKDQIESMKSNAAALRSKAGPKPAPASAKGADVASLKNESQNERRPLFDLDEED